MTRLPSCDVPRACSLQRAACCVGSSSVGIGRWNYVFGPKNTIKQKSRFERATMFGQSIPTHCRYGLISLGVGPKDFSLASLVDFEQGHRAPYFAGLRQISQNKKLMAQEGIETRRFQSFFPYLPGSSSSKSLAAAKCITVFFFLTAL